MLLGAPASNWPVRSSPDPAPQSGNKMDLLPPQDKSAGQNCSALKSAASRGSLCEAGKLHTVALSGSRQSHLESGSPARQAPDGKLEHLT